MDVPGWTRGTSKLHLLTLADNFPTNKGTLPYVKIYEVKPTWIKKI